MRLGNTRLLLRIVISNGFILRKKILFCEFFYFFFRSFRLLYEMSKRKSDASDKIALVRSNLLKYQQAMEEAPATDEEDGGVNDEMARGKKKRERLCSRSYLPLSRCFQAISLPLVLDRTLFLAKSRINTGRNRPVHNFGWLVHFFLSVQVIPRD